MSYYSAIYGLQLHLNHGVPGLLLSTQQSQPVDVRVHFGSMPLPEEQSARTLWYLNPEAGPGGKPRLTVWSLPGYYHLQYADGTQFLIDNSGTRIWAIWPTETLTLEDTATYLLGPVMGFVLLLRGFISLHACAVVINNRAVAIAGPAGSGKSTTAAAFAEAGYRVLAEDVVTLRDHGDRLKAIDTSESHDGCLAGCNRAAPEITSKW